jgi:phenylpropionate dioxygenase-like ring-hydroxylating dioxygenase large terminal subunit
VTESLASTAAHRFAVVSTMGLSFVELRVDQGRVPSFEAARTRRQQTRAAGLHPDHWYAVEYEAALGTGQAIGVAFWGRGIALFRGADGVVRAIEDRCAHRQVKLSLGEVDGCDLTCPYHGWTYGGDGRLTTIPHELFGRTVSKIRVAAFPVRVRYGLIWIFPGDPALAEGVKLPEIPEIEGRDAWATVHLDFTWNAHHSMIIENVSDFTHAHLHRKYRPFTDAKLISHSADDRAVHLTYDVLVGDGRFSKHFVDRKKVNVNSMDLCFDYPYQRSDTGGRIKHWLFILPVNERKTRAFFVFYFDALKIPLTGVALPAALMRPLMRAARHLVIGPLLEQDGDMVEAEQDAYDSAPDAPYVELNPVVLEFQKLIIARWREHLARETPAAPVPAAHSVG